jgi:hypothetical protein
MVYSAVQVTGNLADQADDSDSLLVFAAKRARKNFWEGIAGIDDGPNIPGAGPYFVLQTVATPFVFLYYAAAGHFKYKIKPEPSALKEKPSELEGRL